MPHAREAGKPRIGDGALVDPRAIRFAVCVDELGVAAVALGVFFELKKDAFSAGAVAFIVGRVRKVEQAIGELNIE